MTRTRQNIIKTHNGPVGEQVCQEKAITWGLIEGGDTHEMHEGQRMKSKGGGQKKKLKNEKMKTTRRV